MNLLSRRLTADILAKNTMVTSLFPDKLDAWMTPQEQRGDRSCFLSVFISEDMVTVGVHRIVCNSRMVMLDEKMSPELPLKQW